MNKTAIKNFAIWARNKLIADVSYDARLIGITEDGIAKPLPQSFGGTQFFDIGTAEPYSISGEAVRQRDKLIEVIQQKEKDTDYKTAYQYVIEEVAYTWFNRLIAIRFMEVNDYLPSHIRVLSSESGKLEPDLVTTPFDAELPFTAEEEAQIFQLKQDNKLDEAFRILFLKQCNALNEILPALFEKTKNYTELLLSLSVIDQDGVVYHLIHDIPEDDFNIERGGQVEIIGWLYQYYNTEPKAAAFAKNGKITKEEIPAVTQLFTPDWIVRYMVENSLGRLWVEGHPDCGLKENWKYYLEEAQQEPEVQAQLAEIRKEYAALTPEQLKVIDPCSGSGHILAYMFDVLMKIYESYGYTTREAVASIVENNLYGLDIDDRAAQLAYFAVMMKARQYDRRFFSRGIQPHVYAIVESNHVDKFAVDYFCNGDMKLTAAMDTVIKELHDAKEYGSILTVTPQDWSALYDRFAEITEDINISRETALRELLPLVRVAEALAQKYDVAITNPPYMSGSGMGAKLSNYVKKYYPDSKSDLFAIFIEHCGQMAKKNRYQAMITQHAWMFLSSFEKLRGKLLNTDIVNMAHLGARAFEEIGGEVVQTTSFVIRKSHVVGYKGEYCRLIEPTTQQGKEEMFLTCESRYSAEQSNFSKIPGSPVAYWLSSKAVTAFGKGNALGKLENVCGGLTTGDNNRFLRLWFEVNLPLISFDTSSMQETEEMKYTWYPMTKGGDYRKWYGNNEYVVNWKNNGEEIKYWVTHNPKDPNTKHWSRRLFNTESYFKKVITWSGISSGAPSMRIVDHSIFGSGAKAIVPEGKDEFYIAYLNSVVALMYLGALSPTLNYESGHIASLPVIVSDNDRISNIVKENIKISKRDWDSFETSWDFQRHPLLQHAVFTPQMVAKEEANGYLTINGIADAYRHWEQVCNERFNQLKANEEELNRIFIDIYGLQDELTPEVADKDVTVRKADLGRDIRSFISYAVGCMFGRYSLDVDGLAYAGGEWDSSKYASFAADKDNIIPICDDEYFEDDIVGLFVEFVKTVYGADTLDKNLKFIADALGGKGQPKDVIRNYFLNEFYSDHCKIYQKRPIYWLFDSGKKNGFKALIYMHRYQPDTIARIRTDYVHEQQARYRTAIADLEQRIANASTGERVKLNKKLTTLQAQDTEIRTYEEKIHHLADQMISIDLDDGVKKNYTIFQDVLAKIK